MGSFLLQATDYSEAVLLNKAAKIMRRQMISQEFSFGGSFYDGYVEESLPPAVLQFICMIEHGVDIQSKLRFGASKTDLAMAQLLQYNCYAKNREGAKTFRHSKERETPFPVFMGMSVYAKTRKKVLIDLLHEHPTNIKTDQACLKFADEIEWLDKVSVTEHQTVNLSITWPAHHASKQRGLAFDESITSLLPLLCESAHSVATIRHVMDRVKDTVAYLNPDQTPVIAADQPIYTIAKQIQWQWPDLINMEKTGM